MVNFNIIVKQSIFECLPCQKSVDIAKECDALQC